MKKVAALLAVTLLTMSVVTPPPTHAGGNKAKSEVVMKMGNKVHLFHSGNVAAQKEIAIGDVITVYRVYAKTGQQKEIGQVKVLSFIGENYFEGEIIKGEVKVGDIAKKAATSLLVQPAR